MKSSLLKRSKEPEMRALALFLPLGIKNRTEKLYLKCSNQDKVISSCNSPWGTINITSRISVNISLQNRPKLIVFIIGKGQSDTYSIIHNPRFQTSKEDLAVIIEISESL